METGKWKDSAFIKALLAVLRALLIILGIAVTSILFIETAMRLFGMSWAGYEEPLIMAVFWLYMVGTAHASFENSHIKADILGALMKPGIALHTIQLIQWICTLILGIIMCWWGISLCMWSIEQGNQTIVYRWPMVIGQASIVFGLAVGTLFHVLHLIDHAKFYIKTYVKKEKEVTA